MLREKKNNFTKTVALDPLFFRLQKFQNKKEIYPLPKEIGIMYYRK